MLKAFGKPIASDLSVLVEDLHPQVREASAANSRRDGVFNRDGEQNFKIPGTLNTAVKNAEELMDILVYELEEDE